MAVTEREKLKLESLPPGRPTRTDTIVRPDNPLYPIMVGLSLFPILLGPAGHHLAEDMPEEDTHPFFPDHFWPYPIIMVFELLVVGSMSYFLKGLEVLEPQANPRIPYIPRPDWYFMALYQFLKLGPEILMAIVLPGLITLIILFWPFIDQGLGPKVAKLLGWKEWKKPGRNPITASIMLIFLCFFVFLSWWALTGTVIAGIPGG